MVLQQAESILKEWRYMTKPDDDRHAEVSAVEFLLQGRRLTHSQVVVGRAPAQRLIMAYYLFVTFARNRPAGEYTIQERTHLCGSNRAAETEKHNPFALRSCSGCGAGHQENLNRLI